MENNLEYHPFICLKNILQDNNIYQLTNSYIYPNYIRQKKENILKNIYILKGEKSWKPVYGRS